MKWWVATITLQDGSVYYHSLCAPTTRKAEKVIRNGLAPLYGWTIRSIQID